MKSDNFSTSAGMWRVVFYERRAGRIEKDQSGPWLPDKNIAQGWANWYLHLGYNVALMNQTGTLEKLCNGLPG